MVVIMNAAGPLATHCSPKTTSPFPRPSRSTPTTARCPISPQRGMGAPRSRRTAVKTTPAISQRMPAKSRGAPRSPRSGSRDRSYPRSRTRSPTLPERGRLREGALKRFSRDGFAAERNLECVGRLDRRFRRLPSRRMRANEQGSGFLHRRSSAAPRHLQGPRRMGSWQNIFL